MPSVRHRLLLPALAALLVSTPVSAGPEFSKGTAGAFAPTSGVVTFDTDAGTWSGTTSGSGGRIIKQNGTVEVMAFDFTTITVPAGVTIRAKGLRALALLSSGPVQVDGVVDVSGQDSGGDLGSKGGAGGVGAGGGGGGGDDGYPSNSVSTDIPTGGTGGPGGGGDGCKGGFNQAPIVLYADGSGGIANGKRGANGTGGAGGGSDAGTPPMDPSHPYAGGGGGGGPGGGNGGSYGLLTGCTGASGAGTGAGGGFGTVGGDGRRLNDPGKVPGGGTYGTDDLQLLQGGSGGGGGATDTGYPPAHNGGAGGGGALMITSLVSITLGASAEIRANGGTPRGNPATNDAAFLAAGGAGSGGAIYLDAPKVTNGGTVCAKGGAEGKGGPFASKGYCTVAYDAPGGAGGGGRVVLFGATAAGTVCQGTGTTKIGNFRCTEDGQCGPGAFCNPQHECQAIPIPDAGPDAAPTDSGIGPGDGGAIDAGVDSGTLAGGGCDCSTATSTRGPGLFALALGVAACAHLLRRRRR